MELGMPLRCCHPPPNTDQPPGAPSAISAGAWPRSSHLAVARARPRPRRAGDLRVAAPDSRPLGAAVCANNVGQGTKPSSWPRSSHPAVDLLGRPPRRLRRRARALQAAAALTNCRRSDDEAIIRTNGVIQDTKLPRVGRFFELEMTVRDCELDEYRGVVDNAVYTCYMETARQEMLARLGVSMGSIARTGRAMALSELSVKYLAPLKRGAKFVVMVRVVQIKGVRMLMEHLIATLPERQLVLEAMGTVVCLNESYRPTRMFPEMANLLRFF